uniref:TF-B3 domain-containing protein n=2 Tax=Chenopodium quinoa TaxID=63459 RepID=A0A803L4T5_CHEQI
MWNELPQMVVLKSPGGSTWEVQLVRDDNNTLFFKDGWKEFAKAHNFKENDLLMFKYTRDSCFKVWMLSGRNLCEIAGSYFVKKSALGKNDAGENSKLKRKNTAEGSAKATGNKDNSELEDLDTERASRRKNRRNSTGCGLRNSGAEEKNRSTDDTLDRVPPSEADKERALQMANRDLTVKSFIVVLKDCNVSQYYRLGVPAPWSRSYLTRKHQDMELRANGKKWIVRFNAEPRYGGGVFISGWSTFAVDNLLQESDVCLFKLVSQKDEPVIFDVSIYRAVPEAAHLPSHKTPKV